MNLITLLVLLESEREHLSPLLHKRPTRVHARSRPTLASQIFHSHEEEATTNYTSTSNKAIGYTHIYYEQPNV